jgi:hypothetical protein
MIGRGALARASLGEGPLCAIVAADPLGWDQPWSEAKFGPPRASGFEALADMGFAAEWTSEWEQAPFPPAPIRSSPPRWLIVIPRSPGDRA